MISPDRDPIGVDIVESLAEMQFDYIELSLAHMTALAEPAFSDLVKRVERSGIACEACNNFFPAKIRLTGPEADRSIALDYAGRAFERAERLGAKIIVFGSSGAKNVPSGFPYDDAWRQIVELLRALGPLAEAHGLTIAIEHLNRKESNIVTLAAEGMRLSREVDHPNVRLLIDFYHLGQEHEDLGVLAEARSEIRHIHFAEVQKRIFPVDEQRDYVTFFEGLRRIQYDARCSIEAFTDDFATDAARGLATLKAIAARLDGDVVRG